LANCNKHKIQRRDTQTIRLAKFATINERFSFRRKNYIEVNIWQALGVYKANA